jgi:hypothetical protein
MSLNLLYMNTYLDTALSIILIILIFSVITYVIQELIAVNLQSRGKMLYLAIGKLLDASGQQKKLADTFFSHAEIASLQKNPKRFPSYIPATNFALAIMDMVAAKSPVARTNNYFEDVRSGLLTFSSTDGNLFAVLKNLADTSSDIKDLQHKLELWFNNYMDRVSGWYQANTVKTVRVIAVVVTISFNLNIIQMTREIAGNSALRANMAGMAQGIAAHPESVTNLFKIPDSASKKELLTDEAIKKYNSDRIAAIKNLSTELSATSLPLGWKDPPEAIGLLTVLGWLITAGCISMGAPFWFNLLIQLVNLRRAGIKPADGSGKKN